MSEQNGRDRRPDPEKMLQKVQKIKEELEKADQLLSSFVELPISFSEGDIGASIVRLFGAIRVKKIEATRVEKRWQAVIDKKLDVR